jgi:RNA polymerase sigma-70 factor (ECF subfamily)
MSLQDDKHSQYIEFLMGNRNSICGFILTMVPHADDAEDILQDTCKLIWQKFEDYKEGTSFKSWALTIARYKVLEYYRSKQRNKVKFSSQTIDAVSSYLTEHKDDDEDRERDLLKRCLSKLAVKDRELIQQKYAQKITTKELAIQFGRSVSGLYGTLERIHRMLVDCVQKNANTGEPLL